MGPHSPKAGRWQMVRGPLAATVAYLLDMGWQPRGSDEWLDTHGTKHTIHTPQQECRVLDLLQQTYQKEVNHRIATGLAAPELQEGVDWTVGRKLLGEFKKEGRATKAAALRCVWQGALVCSQNSAVKVCPPMPRGSRLGACPPGLCLVGGPKLGVANMVPRRQGPRPEIAVDQGPPAQTQMGGTASTGGQSHLSGYMGNKEALNDPELVYGTDASGGPCTADPRLRQVAYAVVACKKQGQEYVQVGAIVGQVPGPQTVFRGELYAVLQLARAIPTVTSGGSCKPLMSTASK